MGIIKGSLTMLLLAAMLLATGQSAYAVGKEIATPTFITIDPPPYGTLVKVTLIMHYQNIVTETDDTANIPDDDPTTTPNGICSGGFLDFEADLAFFAILEKHKNRHHHKNRFLFSGADPTRICATDEVTPGTIIRPFLENALATVLGRPVPAFKVKSAKILDDLSMGAEDAPPFFVALELVLGVPRAYRGHGEDEDDD